jgi:type III secretory pathway component EscV
MISQENETLLFCRSHFVVSDISLFVLLILVGIVDHHCLCFLFINKITKRQQINIRNKNKKTTTKTKTKTKNKNKKQTKQTKQTIKQNKQSNKTNNQTNNQKQLKKNKVKTEIRED